MSKRYYFFTETAFHHEGDLDYLKDLIRDSAAAKVNGIKFQVVIDINRLISVHHPAFEKLKRYTFTVDQWQEAFDVAKQHGLDVIVMPLDELSFDVIATNKKNIPYLELHSVSYFDEGLKAAIRKTGLPLILGAGGRTIEEIDDACRYFDHQLAALMVGFQSFPSRIEDVGIGRIPDLKRKYPMLEIGYADHSSFDDPWAVESNPLAYALGATIFEKHITTTEGKTRVDFESAIGVEKLERIRKKLDDTWNLVLSRGTTEDMNVAEINYRNRQKMTVAARDLSAGDVLRDSDLQLKMTGRFDGFAQRDVLIGKKLSVDIVKDMIITKDDIHG